MRFGSNIELTVFFGMFFFHELMKSIMSVIDDDDDDGRTGCGENT